MAGKRKSSRRWGTSDPGDGLSVNRVGTGVFSSRRYTSFSMFDADNIVVEISGKENGSNYHKVSVLGEVRRINISKTSLINRYKHYIYGR